MKGVLGLCLPALLVACLPIPALANSCFDPYEEFHVLAEQEGSRVRVVWWESFSPNEDGQAQFEELRRRLVRENGCDSEVVAEFTLGETASATEVYPHCLPSWDDDVTYEFAIYDHVCVPDGETTYRVEEPAGLDDSGDQVWSGIWNRAELCIRDNADECGSCGDGVNGACADPETGCSFLPRRPTVPLVSALLGIGLALLFLSRKNGGTRRGLCRLGQYGSSQSCSQSKTHS